MSTPKRHHYVPESYLKGFAEDDSGYLHVYSKRTDSFRRQKPSQLMVIGQYYRQDWVPEGMDKNVLEKFLASEVESNGMVCINQLVEDAKKLTDENVASIINYLQFQRIRVPRQAEMAKNLLKQIITSNVLKSPKGAQTLKHAEIVVYDSFRFEFMKMLIGAASPYLSRMIWEVIEAENGSTFITSDSPVNFHNIGFIPPAEAGIGLYGTTVLFPISKRFLLLMQYPQYRSREKAASDRLPDNLEVLDGVIEVQTGRVWNAIQVQNHNRAMFRLSLDLIVGESNEVVRNAAGKESSQQ